MKILSLAAVTAAASLLCLAEARADVDRADAIAEAAHVTAVTMRHRWDEARKNHKTTEACLADKAAQAVVLSHAIDERRAEWKHETEPGAKKQLGKRLENLEERRVALEGDALRCH